MYTKSRPSTQCITVNPSESTFSRYQPFYFLILKVCGTTPCELCGASNIIKIVEKELGIKLGGTTPDGMFTLVEVECAGACINAPVMAVNDDYFV